MYYYILSFFFSFLRVNQNIGKILGIKYVSDKNFTTNRKDSYLYVTGISIWIAQYFLFLKIPIKPEIHKKILTLQHIIVKNISFEDYIELFINKKFTKNEFENLVSYVIFKETNKIFKIYSDIEIEDFNFNFIIIR